QTLAQHAGLSPKQVFVGNGSDEILAFAFASFFDPSKPVLFPDVTYSFYKVYSKFYGITPKLIPLDEQFNINVEQYTGDHGGIIIPNPNAPTAMPLSDRKSTRLNSSHVKISYAVFCLKKKKKRREYE